MTVIINRWQQPVTSTATTGNTKPSILTHLYKNKRRNKPNIAKASTKFWHTLYSAVASGKLSWADISDTPSTLAHGIITLNHQRVTALLEEQQLDCADMPPVIFHLIMQHRYPNTKPHYVGSEHSIVCQGTKQYAERRMGYQIKLAQ